MLQSSVLEPLLTQLLEKTPALTPLVPLSVALVSRAGRKPLVTYTTKESGATNAVEAPAAQEAPNGAQYLIKEHNGYIHHASADGPPTPPEVAVRAEIEHPNDLRYEDDYIDTDTHPQSLLRVLALDVIKEWCGNGEGVEAAQTQTEVFQHDHFLFYIHGVNAEYGVMLVCAEAYPSELAMGKLENLCSILAQRLEI